MIEQMDEWELSQFAVSLVLPPRPDEVAGLLVTDVEFDDHELPFTTRFGGCDFNKARMSFIVPFSQSNSYRFCDIALPEEARGHF